MWIVKNPLRATLSLRGLGVSIPPGEEFDIDVLGRDAAEQSPQVAVAFEEGYLTNVFKAPRDASTATTGAVRVAAADLTGLMTSADFEKFKAQFLAELRAQVPALQKLDELAQRPSVDIKAELESFRKSLATDVREATDGLKKVASKRIEAEKQRILADASLSEAEMKARLAFLDDKERELAKNFDTVGKKIEGEDGDVMDKADLLSGEL